MATLERSVALRRMGITEWLPRLDDAAVVSVDEPRIEQPAGRRSESVAASGETRTVATADVANVAITATTTIATPAQSPAAMAVASAPPVTTPASAAKSVEASQIAAVPAGASVAIPGLRGRLLTAESAAPLLVLAMAEKSPRDTLLNPDAASGVLLKAMLAELPTAACVALLGVERGEPVAVPATILVLGERSARLLLGNDVKMPLRGRVHLFGQARVVVSYHPDELRQNSSLKRLAWDDLRLLASLLTSTASPSAGLS